MHLGGDELVTVLRIAGPHVARPLGAVHRRDGSGREDVLSLTRQCPVKNGTNGSGTKPDRGDRTIKRVGRRKPIMSKINRKKRKESFMVKPATGWLHDDRALNAGRGVYVRCGLPSA